jgi:hypothetical protein
VTRHDPVAGVRWSPRRAVRGFVAAGTLAALLALSLPADADPTPVEPASPVSSSAADLGSPAPTTPDPTAANPSPAASASPSASPRTGASASTGASGSTSGPASTGAGSGNTATGSGNRTGENTGAADGDSRAITLAVAPAGSPVAGRYFSDLGSFAFSGTVGAQDATHTVAIYRRATGATSWQKLAQPTSAADGSFTATVPVTDAGAFTMAASISGPPSDDDAIVSNEIAVTVERSTVTMDKLVGSIDSLKDPTVTGRVFPARSGVAIIVDVNVSGKYVKTAAATTGATGTYKTTVPYGRGNLASYTVRTRYVTANRPTRSETSGASAFTRIAVINAAVTNTTAAEVAKTYRAGCPVGASKLRTITMNFYGFDKRMHRGVLIVRKDLTSKVIRGFSSAISHRYPVAKMNNPNVYGGNDPKQMAADNTSGFNCRKVVGNPYKMSPHSYGIAIDVNTVRNPYRDAKGKWWPANGKKYVKRTPRKFGMLTKNSSLTKSLRKDKFFWGGFWSPGRDYQHFEYRG